MYRRSKPEEGVITFDIGEDQDGKDIALEVTGLLELPTFRDLWRARVAFRLLVDFEPMLKYTRLVRKRKKI